MKLTILMTLLALTLGQVPAFGQVAAYPYIQDFESGPGTWTSGGTGSSWAFGTPAKPVINSAASGVNCWVSGGLSGVYPNNEQSYVLGPTFTFAALSGPVIQLSVWWECEFSWDGAVLQSSIDSGMTWQNVGSFGDPNNWYTDNTILGLDWSQPPGGASEGWCGYTGGGTGSGSWVTAVHDLSSLSGQPNVQLRVAFGTDAPSPTRASPSTTSSSTTARLTTPERSAETFSWNGVNGAATSGLGFYVKTATALDAISLSLISPGGTYDFQPYVILAQPFTTGSPPSATIPGLVSARPDAALRDPGQHPPLPHQGPEPSGIEVRLHHALRLRRPELPVPGRLPDPRPSRSLTATRSPSCSAPSSGIARRPPSARPRLGLRVLRKPGRFTLRVAPEPDSAARASGRGS